MRLSSSLLDEIFARWDVCTESLVGSEIFLEYTDAPSTESPPSADTMTCPLCGHVLPQNAESCDRCDWVRSPETSVAEGKASDLVAVMLSVIPGLGHVYKGYKMLGLVFVIGAFGAILLGALAATATAGFGLALIPIYWFAVMFHVYGIDDRISSSEKDEGEQY